jgi:hypothetical protein
VHDRDGLRRDVMSQIHDWPGLTGTETAWEGFTPDAVIVQDVCPDCDRGLLYAPVRFCPYCQGRGVVIARIESRRILGVPPYHPSMSTNTDVPDRPVDAADPGTGPQSAVTGPDSENAGPADMAHDRHRKNTDPGIRTPQ